MTLAAVMRCSGGIVMCADSQESVGDYQYPVEKLVTHWTPFESIAVAGSGRAGLVDMVAEQLVDKLEGGYDSILAYEQQVRKILTALYKNEIAAYPASTDDKLVDMLVAIKPNHISNLCLLKCEATAVSRVKNFEVVGAGRVVRYELDQLWRLHMPLRQGVVAAIHLLRIAKTALHIVGGKGSIATITDDGRMAVEPDWNIFDIDRSLWPLRHWALDVLVHAGDATVSETDFRAKLKEFNDIALEAYGKAVFNAESWKEIERLVNPPARQSASQTSVPEK